MRFKMCLKLYYVHDDDDDDDVDVFDYGINIVSKKCQQPQRFCSIETWTLSEKIVETQVVEVEFTARTAKETKIV